MKTASLLAILPFLLLAVDAAPARCTKRPGPRPSSSAIAAVPAAGGPINAASSAKASMSQAQSSKSAAAPVLVEVPKPTATVTKVEPKPVEPKPSSAAAPAAPAAPVPAAAPAGGKSAVGLAINGESKANVPSFGGKLGWYYSWNLSPLPNTDGLEFIPMVWGGDAAKTFTAAQLPSGATHVLGFNEPDIGPQYGGSNMSPAAAAELHKAWTAKVPAGVKIGAPAVARGGAKWLREFNAACGGQCKYDFVPFHFYGTNAQDLVQYTKDFYAEFKKPLWVTEVACHDYSTNMICSKDETKAFMKTAIGFWRTPESHVERWSWFGAFPNHAKTNSNGLLNEDGSANDIGLYYASL